MSICGAVITIDKVIDIYLKFKKRAENPTESIKARVDKLEEEVDKIHGFLANDKKRLDQHDTGVSVLQRAILALIDNAIDGTDKAPLYKAKEDLNSYLIERQLER